MASIASFTVACAATSEEAGTNSEAVTAKNNDTDGGAATGDDDDDTTSTDAGTGLSAACQAKLNAAFPGQDKYQWTPVKESKAVVDCCDEAFENHGFGAGHRWACCVAYDKLDSHGDPLTVSRQADHGMACTPWGPPVPPRMNRMRRATPARRDMNLALTVHMGLVA
jgi:hypothetical protein